MSEPQTLLQMQTAPSHPAPLEGATLVLIDIQEEYRSGRLPLERVTDAAEAAGRLLTLARDHEVPVVHVKHRLPQGSPLFDPDSPTSGLMSEVSARDGETVIEKALPNAFAGTSLDEVLRRTDRRELIFAGMMTHMCVSATVRAALDHGYRSTVVASACTTRDLPDGCGGVVAAADVHRIALAELADAFAVVVDDVSAWER